MTATVRPPQEVPPARLAAPGAAALAAAGYLGGAAFADPYSATTIAGVPVGCPLHAATGGFCPGCGSTRAVHELVHGDVVASLACHPLVLPLAGLLTYLWASWLARRRGADPWWARTPTELPAVVPVVIAVAFVALTVVRNVPGLEWLPPPEVAP